MVICDKGDWDIIDDIHEFNETWVKECIRVLADDGTIWISGTLHNHPSIGVILKKLNLCIHRKWNYRSDCEKIEKKFYWI